MAENGKSLRDLAKKLILRTLKAFLKSLVFYMAYLFVWSFFAHFESYVPGLGRTVENFVTVYVLLGFFGDLVAETVFQHFFSVAKALFVVGYLTLTLNGGILNLNYMSVSLTVDLRLFLAAAVLLSLLGLARSMLQAINYANKKSEPPFYL